MIENFNLAIFDDHFYDGYFGKRTTTLDNIVLASNIIVQYTEITVLYASSYVML